MGEPETADRFGKRADRPEPFMRRHALAAAVCLGSLAVFGGAAYLFISGDDAPPARRGQELTIVNIIPPPPPPPPPQEMQPQPEPEMIEQPKMVEPEIKAEEPVEEPKEAPPEEASDEPPPGPLGLDQAAEGPGDQFNLAGKPGGRGILGGGGGGGSKWGWYATIVTQQIESALRDNPKTRHLVGQVQVRLWADGSGRVSRVQLVTSSGKPEIDAMISGQVLAGLLLRQPPPTDMPMPIVTRITGRRTT
jgi:type IV secretory pathway VirB10-like protein